MKIHRFYIEPRVMAELPKEADELSLFSAPLSNQLIKVLKIGFGEKVILFNGDGNEYVSSFISGDKKGNMVFKIESIEKNTIINKKEIFLFSSLIKKDNYEWVLEKGTEIGVSHFIPIISARSEKKDINIERSQKIIIEAVEQSGRNIIPTLEPIMKVPEIFEKFDMSMISFDHKQKTVDIKIFENENKIGILIGPEGGWTDEEIELFKSKRATLWSLGDAVLRAETASIVTSSLFLF